MNGNGNRWLLTLLALVVITSSMMAQQLTLRYNFEPGKVYRYTDMVAGTSTQEMGGQEMKAIIDSRMTQRLSAEKKGADGKIVLIASADSMRMHIKSPQQDTTMTLAEYTGKRTRLTLTDLGLVSKREVIDSIKGQGGLRGMVNREVMKFHRLPEKQIVLSQKWQATVVDTTEMAGGKLVTTTNMEYMPVAMEKKGGHNCVKVTYTGKNSLVGKGSMMGMELFMEGSGKISGTYYFDAEHGLMVNDESQINNDMTMAVTGQQNMTIPTSQSMKYVHSLLEE